MGSFSQVGASGKPGTLHALGTRGIHGWYLRDGPSDALLCIHVCIRSACILTITPVYTRNAFNRSDRVVERRTLSFCNFMIIYDNNITRVYTERVGGSSPSSPTKFIRYLAGNTERFGCSGCTAMPLKEELFAVV